MDKGSDKKRLLIIFSTLFILIIPAILIVISATWLGRSLEIAEEIEEGAAEFVTPSQILDDKIIFKDQFLVVRGQVVMEDVVCERKSCPKEDSCCGCKNERNLMVVDSGMSPLRRLPGKLLILAPDKQPLCWRKQNSCDYDCPGWQVGGIYRILGTFRAEPPPRGTALNIYFGYYLEAEENKLVGRLGIFERASALFSDLKNYIASSKAGTYYILH